jgi:pSer/pThr/pTyr-binding forkhead associated (FHA) protein
MVDNKGQTTYLGQARPTEEPPVVNISGDPPPRQVILDVIEGRTKHPIKLVLGGEPVVVGRAGDENLTDVDMTPYNGLQYGVSRRHAMLYIEVMHLYIQDMGSTNGTRINGFTLEPGRAYRLRNGDEIEFGQLRTQVRFVR